MMQAHMKVRRPNRWPSSARLVASAGSLLFIVLLLAGGSEAIVKQNQQRSDDSQQQQQSQQAANSNSQAQPQSQSQSQQQQHSHQQSSAYQNHQQNSGAQASQSSAAQAAQPSYSSSVSVSSSASAPSASSAGQSSQVSAVPQSISYTNYAPSASSSKYMDSMAAAATNPEQSYQVAANNVNMALASSGIFAPSSSNYAPSAGSSSSSSQQQQQPQALNPLHYFYYPAKESSSSAASSQQAGVQAKAAADIMNSASNNNYQSYPSYADQLSSALSSMGSGAEAAASNQDASYLPQPAEMFNGQSSQQQGSQHQQQSQSQQQQQASSAQAQQHQNSFAGDLSAYINQNGAQQSASSASSSQHNSPSSISFNGPSSSGIVGDYMNSHMGGSGHQQSAYQNNLYSQLGDLSTSNFGNNANNLASVASYMAPSHQQHQQGHSAGGQQHDLFGSSFNSAASQLSPSAVSPPSGQQGAGQSSGSSLFSAASSLFSPQQQLSGASQPGGNLFTNQQYLNSFLNPQQFGGFAPQADGQQQQVSPSASGQSSSSVAPSGGSSKRFGISSFIMPMLALAGLSLLIPTMSNIGTAVGRKKRSIEDRASAANRQQQIAFDSMNGSSQLAKETSIGEYMDKIERYYSIYKNAVENDECLNRLICEFGDAVKDITGKSAVVTVIEKLVPNWMTGKVHLFKEAALDNKEGKEKCKKYVCNRNKYQH